MLPILKKTWRQESQCGPFLNCVCHLCLCLCWAAELGGSRVLWLVLPTWTTSWNKKKITIILKNTKCLISQTIKGSLMIHTTVLLLPSPLSLQTCLPPRMSGLLLQWWYWRCRAPREQGVHWRCLGQRGRHQRSAVARWTQESCTPSWSRCVVLHAGVSCIPTGKPGRMQNHNIINEHRAHLEFSWQRAAFWQMLTTHCCMKRMDLFRSPTRWRDARQNIRLDKSWFPHLLCITYRHQTLSVDCIVFWLLPANVSFLRQKPMDTSQIVFSWFSQVSSRCSLVLFSATRHFGKW